MKANLYSGAVALAAFTLQACATTTPVANDPPVDPAAFAWSQTEGSNSIAGDALLRTRGGEVRTCAGLDVKLIPSTPYTDAFVARVYPGGYRPLDYVFQTRPQMDPAALPFVKSKRCNAQGEFLFSQLPDGPYYVVATVTWEAPGYGGYMAPQGGEIAQPVQVAGGRTETITLTK